MNRAWREKRFTLVTSKTQLAELRRASRYPKLQKLVRDVKYYETIFELLAKQYEIAKIDEAREASLIQVLDKAVEPERKSKPRRALIVILTALVAGFMAVSGGKLRGPPRRGRRSV